ncbi:nitroreductase [Allocatelliglobosispora scoriae]|uniref:Nitroreductase n=1 Tax=Allocatelliglobosispora scoriae TaxID=643052 RepID=A0A841C2Z8_9ACTN|nr:nitroreductase [Allocatelliglobosispora scoriae]MBB5874285.1 nitroreductase [Allocatelliglobosispora scoriae]
MTSTSAPTPGRPLAAALAEAAETAGHAPSIHNTQPWRWRVGTDALDLYADRSRSLPATDPDGRMLLTSCAAALHHAQVALAAEGLLTAVELLPTPAEPDHLARVTITGTAPVTPEAVRLVQAIGMRHTDRRPTIEEELTADQIEQLRQAAAAQGVHLHRLTPDQTTELAVAVSRAEDVAAADPALVAETTRWTGGDRPDGTGVPADVIPDRRPQTDVGERDFAVPGTLRIGGEHDKHAAYVVLFSDTDEPRDWLRAGQAMSAAWLRATELGIAVLPFSQVIEVDATRQLLRRMLADLGYAHLVLRLGIADPDHVGPPRTPRLDAAHTIEIDPAARAAGPAV